MGIWDDETQVQDGCSPTRKHSHYWWNGSWTLMFRMCLPKIDHSLSKECVLLFYSFRLSWSILSLLWSSSTWALTTHTLCSNLLGWVFSCIYTIFWLDQGTWKIIFGILSWAVFVPAQTRWFYISDLLVLSNCQKGILPRECPLSLTWSNLPFNICQAKIK